MPRPIRLVALALAGLALAGLPSPAASAASAPAAPLPSKSEIKRLMPRAADFLSGEDAVELPLPACGQSRTVRARNHSLEWSDRAATTSDGATGQDNLRVTSALVSTTWYRVSVHRMSSARAAHAVMRRTRAAVRRCSTHSGMALRPAAAQRGGDERVGFLLSSREADLGVGQGIALYRDGSRLVSVSTLHFTPDEVGGAPVLPPAALVRVALRG